MKFLLLSLCCLLSFTSFSKPRVIHVLVALCDNEHQGIVPVPPKIGNGTDAPNNLYWGCGYGFKTFFKKQPEWKLLKQIANPQSDIIERLIFKHKDSAIYLVADAYNGAYIRNTTSDLLNYAAGKQKFSIKLDSITINCGGHADLICYIGHDGLMDFQLENYPTRADNTKREVIILACASKNYFSAHVQQTGAHPLLWTTHLMCPEAYTLDAAIDSWVKHEPADKAREAAANAYNQYQKCGIKGARNLLVTGY